MTSLIYLAAPLFTQALEVLSNLPAAQTARIP
jgi:hypothetical protein